MFVMLLVKVLLAFMLIGGPLFWADALYHSGFLT